MNLYKKFTAKPYCLLVIYATHASDNRLCFRKNLLERIKKPIMIIDDKGIDEKLQYDINREAGKISALPSGKIDKYGYLTGKKNIPFESNPNNITSQMSIASFR